MIGIDISKWYFQDIGELPESMLTSCRLKAYTRWIANDVACYGLPTSQEDLSSLWSILQSYINTMCNMKDLYQELLELKLIRACVDSALKIHKQTETVN